jgi:hypothetical protein
VYRLLEVQAALIVSVPTAGILVELLLTPEKNLADEDIGQDLTPFQFGK